MIETKIHSIYLHSTQKKKKIKSKDFPNSGKKAINTFFFTSWQEKLLSTWIEEKKHINPN